MAGGVNEDDGNKEEGNDGDGNDDGSHGDETQISIISEINSKLNTGTMLVRKCTFYFCLLFIVIEL